MPNLDIYRDEHEHRDVHRDIYRDVYRDEHEHRDDQRLVKHVENRFTKLIWTNLGRIKF